VNGLRYKKARTQETSRNLKADKCLCIGRCRERECLLWLGENILKTKGGYCPVLLVSTLAPRVTVESR
jgi:hypothetical protein